MKYTFMILASMLLIASCKPAGPMTPQEEREVERRREELIDRMEQQKRDREYQRSIYQ